VKKQNVRAADFSDGTLAAIKAIAAEKQWSISKTINFLAAIGIEKQKADEAERARMLAGSTQFDPSFRVNL
jgi:hypothetical protein